MLGGLCTETNVLIFYTTSKTAEAIYNICRRLEEFVFLGIFLNIVKSIIFEKKLLESKTYISTGVSEGFSKRKPFINHPRSCLPLMPGYGVAPVVEPKSKL